MYLQKEGNKKKNSEKNIYGSSVAIGYSLF
jgi:hypothetical protein